MEEFYFYVACIVIIAVWMIHGIKKYNREHVSWVEDLQDRY